MLKTNLNMFSATFGRLLIGSFFTISGASNLLNLPQAAENTAAVGIPAASFLVLLIAVLKVIFGILIMTRFHTRTATIILAVYVLFTTLIFYNPLRWEEFPKSEIVFVRNLAVLSALLLLLAHSRGFDLIRGSEKNRLDKNAIANQPDLKASDIQKKLQ